MSEHDIAVLGAGMHPWGKWGRNFVEYGLAAARTALEDAGLAWTDIQYVAGTLTVQPLASRADKPSSSRGPRPA